MGLLTTASSTPEKITKAQMEKWDSFKTGSNTARITRGLFPLSLMQGLKKLNFRDILAHPT